VVDPLVSPQANLQYRKIQPVSSSESTNDSDSCELLTLWDNWFDFNSGDEIVSASLTDCENKETSVTTRY